MKTLLFEYSNLQIWQEGERYFAIYDAGAHLVVMRKDEISAEEAKDACRGTSNAIKMLVALQKRLIANGIDPYASNIGASNLA